jgi:hypothetical protein
MSDLLLFDLPKVEIPPIVPNIHIGTASDRLMLLLLSRMLLVELLLRNADGLTSARLCDLIWEGVLMNENSQNFFGLRWKTNVSSYLFVGHVWEGKSYGGNKLWFELNIETPNQRAMSVRS